ncbi:unnamed protein product [Adineta steineri]|uniref:Uncharacterized protein n=1 Tax=Adineta steineri TaxID=433720 RepID=A0A819PSS3_9BILA|nr:unnamed protein product [Adineta steineri]CAF4022587.1 unnamed protein product [Adineta steineri]
MTSIEENSLMKVYKSSHFTKLAVDSYMSDDDIKNQWIKMIDYYKNHLNCIDDDRIKFEFGKCLDALLNDERKIMMGLESDDVIKDVLITSMRICSEPNFQLEIRVGLGGTVQPLTARVPSYTIAPIALLFRLLLLSKYFSSDQESSTGKRPTIMLSNPPRLVFYSAYTAGVEADKFDATIAKNTAYDILLYMKEYITKYHPKLANYIRYEKDHSKSYEPKLLNKIIHLFTSNCHDEQLIHGLSSQAAAHDSTREDSIKYASTHSIGFRDVIDKKNPYPIFISFDQNEINIPLNQEIILPDSIITIGGSVENRFGRVREIIRQAFKESLQSYNDDQYYFPLSIRMLSKAGHTPVYYHDSKHEITINDVLNGGTQDLYQNNDIPRVVKDDLLIITNDIGILILKPMIDCLHPNKYPETVSFDKCVLDLSICCLEYFEEHNNDENQTNDYSNEITKLADEFFVSNNISIYRTDHTYAIVSCIIKCLKNQDQKKKRKQNKKEKSRQSRMKYAENHPRPHSKSISSIEETISDLRPRSASNLATVPDQDESRPRNDSILSTESLTSDPRSRNNSISSINSATNDLHINHENLLISIDAMNDITKQIDSILCPIFVAFIREFGAKLATNE